MPGKWGRMDVFMITCLKEDTTDLCVSSLIGIFVEEDIEYCNVEWLSQYGCRLNLIILSFIEENSTR